MGTHRHCKLCNSKKPLHNADEALSHLENEHLHETVGLLNMVLQGKKTFGEFYDEFLTHTVKDNR